MQKAIASKKASLLFYLLVFSSQSILAKDLVLSSPSVVILHASKSEITNMQLQDKKGEFVEFSDDFSTNASRFADTLKNYPQVKVISSSTSKVIFSKGRIKPVIRHKLKTEYGYVFYKPNKQPIVLDGVYENTYLECVAEKMFDIKIVGSDCQS